MIFVCVLFFGMSEKVVVAEEQREQNEQNEQHNEQQYEVDVHNRTGLEEFRFVEEIAEEATSDDVMLFALGESIHTNSIEASEAYDYWESMDSDYIYSQLSDMEQAVWDDLEALCVEYAENSEDCEKIKATICFTGMTKEDAKEFVKVFYYSHPQYFFLSNSSGVSVSGESYYPLFYIYEEFRNGEARQSAVAKFKSQINTWSDAVKACDTVVAKEKMALEIIADHTIYDSAALLNQSSYSLVCGGKTVCAGYCGTFAILMNMAGVETQVITGIAGEAHGWNTVKVHGVWYLTDPTWADQNDTKKEGCFYGITYQYLNRSDATISNNRTRDPMWEQYYHLSEYDSGTSGFSYVDPYFTEGNYKYFTVNNNEKLGTLFALPIEPLNGVTIGAAPNSVLHDGQIFSKYVADWSIPKLSICIGSDSDCNELIRQYTEESAVWSSDNPTVATVEDGVVHAKEIGSTVVVAMVGTTRLIFEIMVAGHNYDNPTFTWTSDGSSCEATRVCLRDNNHKEQKQCTIQSEVYKAPTCTKKGITRYKVTAFGVSDTMDISDIDINPDNHAGGLIHVNEKAATVSEEGYSGDLYCDQCHAKMEDGIVIPKLPVGWEHVDGKWRYYSASGIMQTGWLLLGSKWYYFDKINGWMATGWQQINNKWFYFAGSGAMVTGWQQINEKWYYFAGSGVMATGWQQINEKWYYFAGSGVMATGWQLINEKWYYFANSGAMATDWQLINSKWYYFAASGAMVTGWRLVNDKWYFFEVSGVMAVSKWIDGIYYVKANGVMATNEWVDGGRYYVDGNGKWVKGKTR